MSGRYLVFDSDSRSRKVITCSYEKPMKQITVIGEDERYISKFDCFMASSPEIYLKNFTVDVEAYNSPQFSDRPKLVTTIYEALKCLKLAPLELNFVEELIEELRLDVITPRLMESSLHEFMCGDKVTGEYVSI